MATALAEKEKVMEFRVKGGTHTCRNPEWKEGDGKATKSLYYKTGDTVKTTKDLAALFGKNKFERVYKEQDGESGDFLEAMSVKQLKHFAEGEEIELDSTLNKKQIIEAIRSAS